MFASNCKILSLFYDLAETAAIKKGSKQVRKVAAAIGDKK
jgi:hypothetical protein